MKYSTYIWKMDFFSEFKMTIQQSSLKVLFELLLLFITFIFIPVCVLFLVITIPTDISRISIAIVLRARRKYASEKRITPSVRYLPIASYDQKRIQVAKI